MRNELEWNPDVALKEKVTSDDLKAAADGQNMDLEQAANNIHQGAMAPKQAHSS